MKRNQFPYLLLTLLVAFALGGCSGETIEEKVIPHVSIQADGSEIEDEQVVRYEAAANLFGEFVAGHETEPVFSSDVPCKLEVTIEIPENKAKNFQWCGITHQCDNHQKGTFTRVKDDLNAKEGMELHAYFETGVYTSCNVKVNVRANGERVRTFYLEYVYEKKETEPEPEPEPEVEAKLSVLANGKEIKEGEIIRYTAEKNDFGEMVAGHATEPLFGSNIPARLEVSIDIPENNLDYFQWCGINASCDNYKQGTYSRTKENAGAQETMELHAHFKTGEAATCQVKVQAKLNDKLVRTFTLEYVYEVKEEKPLPDAEDYAEPATKSPVVVLSFTGQRCVYCPVQEEVLENSQQKYGRENYIVAALHSLEEYSLLPKGYVSLYNEEAHSYSDRMEIQTGLPHMVYNSVGTFVDDTQLPDMYKLDDLLECTGTVTVSGGEYKVDIKTRLRSNRTEFIAGKKIDILLWSLEDGIKAYQDGVRETKYPIHNHIFRGSLNGFDGEAYQVGTAYQRSLKVPTAVDKVDNTEVVVFFADHTTGEIYDAASFKVQ